MGGAPGAAQRALEIAQAVMSIMMITFKIFSPLTCGIGIHRRNTTIPASSTDSQRETNGW